MSNVKKILTALLVPCLAACAGGENVAVDNEELAGIEDSVRRNELGIPLDGYDTYEERVERGDFFSTILNGYGVSNQRIYKISESIKDTFDIRDIRVGNEYTAYVSQADTSLGFWVYSIDKRRSLVIDISDPDTVEAFVFRKQMEAVPRYTDVSIENSLWYDMVQAGASPLLILKLSDIYAWTVDFFALQKGDTFRVLYDEIMCDGEVFEIGDVRYVEFVHNGELFPSIMFDQGDGGNIYWNEKGESMRRAFLKAPLNYSRISSGFSYARRHPVTRKVQPHTGVDYAAPTGTPVMSVGDGTVIECRYRGANGNIVKIRHNSIYTTAYLHLSRFAKGMYVGKRVRQGDVIGYVGSTGRSTGPHLDYRIWKNGTAINPLKMESPSEEPLKKENMEAFMAVMASYKSGIDSVYAEKLYEEAMEFFSSPLADDVESVPQGQDH